MQSLCSVHLCNCLWGRHVGLMQSAVVCALCVNHQGRVQSCKVGLQQMLHELGKWADSPPLRTLLPQPISIFSNIDLDQRAVDRMMTDGVWACDAGVSAGGRVLEMCASSKDSIMFLDPLFCASSAVADAASSSNSPAVCRTHSWSSAMQSRRCTVALLNVSPPSKGAGRGTHWVCVQSRFSGTAVDVDVYDSASPDGSMDRGVLETAGVYHRCSSSSSTKARGSSTGCGENSTSGSNRYAHTLSTPFQPAIKYSYQALPSSYPPGRVLRLVLWHCIAWQCPEGTAVTIRVRYTAQQADGWSCSRWALANTAAVFDCCGAPQLSRSLHDVLELGRWLMVAATSGAVAATTCSRGTGGST